MNKDILLLSKPHLEDELNNIFSVEFQNSLPFKMDKYKKEEDGSDLGHAFLEVSDRDENFIGTLILPLGGLKQSDANRLFLLAQISLLASENLLCGKKIGEKAFDNKRGIHIDAEGLILTWIPEGNPGKSLVDIKMLAVTQRVRVKEALAKASTEAKEYWKQNLDQRILTTTREKAEEEAAKITKNIKRLLANKKKKRNKKKK